MGQHKVEETLDERRIQSFTGELLKDLEALDELIRQGAIESGVERMGLEQELFLIDRNGRPAPCGPELLAAVDDPRLTTELARFNLEANLPPKALGGSFLRELEDELTAILAMIATAGEAQGVRPLLTGILPSLRLDDLGLHNMTPLPRYRQLNDALAASRGGDFSVYIRGRDLLELRVEHVMFEAANTSLQLHLQSSADEIPHQYNLAQAITAPLLAAAVNSPVLFGRRLWHESRVALFESAVDARSRAERKRGKHPRVTFGSDWLHQSALELFRDTVARFPVILACDPKQSDGPPALAALNLHNGTVWRWNRICYGVADGVAHLRIENRVLPAGPTVLDEVANAALFYGLMKAFQGTAREIPSRLAFDDARGNFIKAARLGPTAELVWLDGQRCSARELLLDELLPAADAGLEEIGVPAEERQRYLGTIEQRLLQDRTGARWLMEAFSQPGASAPALCRRLEQHQSSGEPIHRWPAPTAEQPPRRSLCIADVMTQDVFTVKPKDIADLATSMMTWKHFRHVPVEASDGRLVGLLSHRALLELGRKGRTDGAIAAEEIMDPEPLRVPPDLALLEAIRLLLDQRRGCLLVVDDNQHLIGIATEHDLLKALLGWVA
ncbi:MAG: CBS domain-containing protein [Acidobacteriota bacterium]